jgi:hypothetical protein
LKEVLAYIKSHPDSGLERFIAKSEQFPEDEILDTRLRGLVKHMRSLQKHFRIHLNRLAKEIGEEKPYEM